VPVYGIPAFSISVFGRLVSGQLTVLASGRNVDTLTARAW
jgi:hypothetical protein